MTVTSTPDAASARVGILSSAYLATTIGVFSLIAFSAFEAMAVTAIMPTVSRDLDGIALYAVAFAAPLASAVVGMVAAGSWSDRRGPSGPLLVALVLFSAGVLVAGLAPSMEVFVAGRVVQGLGAGSLMVSLYVVVGAVYPARLQPAIFASFAAAWVLPSLFGPGIAAFVAETVGWRWVFLGVVGLVAVAALLVVPVARSLRSPTSDRAPAPRSRLAWAALAAAAVLGVELAGKEGGVVLAAVAAAAVLVALRPLTPRGTLQAARGLPSVIGTRGMMSGAFFSGQAYIVLVLENRWGYSPALAGVALTVAGVVWAAMSQVQARLGDRITSEQAMRIGTAIVLVADVALWLTVRLDAPGWAAGAALVLAGSGMGMGFSRTGVAMLAASSAQDRGFNSSALSIADSIGAALSLSICGTGYQLARAQGVDPFLVVFGVGIVFAIAAVITANRTPVPATTAGAVPA